MKKRIIVTLIIFVSQVMLSCTAGPRQNNLDKPKDAPHDQSKTPDRNAVDTTQQYTVGSSAEKDDISRANSLKPIVYGKGAAGIDFNTTLEDSKKLFNPPTYGPDSDGWAAYQSGAIILWGLRGAQKARLIVATDDYLGPIDLGEAMGTVRMRHKFEQYRLDDVSVPTEKKAQTLARDLYRSLENKPEAEYPCGGDCMVIGWETPNRDNFLIVLPGMVPFFSKENYKLYYINIVSETPQGPFSSPFDLVQGQLLDNEMKAIVSLGTKNSEVESLYAAIESQLEFKPEAVLSWPSMMFKDYSGIGFGYQRAVGNSSLSGSEALKMISVYSGYETPILVNKQFVNYEMGEDGYVFTKSESQGEKPLKIKMELPEKTSLMFSQGLKSFLETELKETYPTEKQTSLLQGLHSLKENREYDFQIVSYDAEAKKGHYIMVSMDGKQGNLTEALVFDMNAQTEPSDFHVIPALMADVEKKEGQPYRMLGGFSIGQKVRLSNIDGPEREATITPVMTVTGEEGTTEKEMFSVHTRSDKKDLIKMALDTESEKIVTLTTANVSTPGVSLGIKLTSEGSGQAEGVISYISTGAQFGAVKGICGLETPIKLGMLYQEVIDTVKSKAKEKSIDCPQKIVRSSTGSGAIIAIYYPTQRLKLIVENREIRNIAIYEDVKGAQ